MRRPLHHKRSSKEDFGPSQKSDYDDPTNNHLTTAVQPINNGVTSGVQPDNIRLTAESTPTNNRLTTTVQPINNDVTSTVQPDNNHGTIRLTNPHLSELVGLQRNILIKIFESCRSVGEKVSPQLTKDYFINALKITPNTLSVSLNRLRSKGYIASVESKKCRGGWARYRIIDAVYSQLIAAEPLNNHGTIHSTDQTIISSSSESRSFFKTTTTEKDDNWKNVDVSILSDIGFGTSQLFQLRSLGLNPEIVQSSIVHFDFEYHHTPSGKSIKQPLSLFMKRMRDNGCWPAPDEYLKRRNHFSSEFESIEKSDLDTNLDF